MQTPFVAPAALLSLSGLLCAGPVRAQPVQSFELTWTAPPGCPAQAQVRQRVEALVGAARPAKEPLSAAGTITQTGDSRFRLMLVVRSGDLVGERNIESTSCADLAGAAAVTLALLLRSEEPLGDLAQLPPEGSTGATGRSPSTSPRKSDGTSPERAGSESRPKGDQEATKDTEDEDTESAAPGARDSAASSSRALHGLVQAPRVALSLGPLPNPSFGLGLAGGVSFADFRFLLEGEKWWEQSVASEDFPGFGADVDRITVTARGCRELRWQRFTVAPCLTLSIEHIRAVGTGPELEPRSQRATWLAPSAGVQGLLHLTSWLSLVASLDAHIEASRPQITIDGLGDVAELAPAAVTIIVGSEWIL